MMKLLKLKHVIFIGLLMVCGMALAKDPVYKFEDQAITVTKDKPSFGVELEYKMGTGYAWEENAEYDSSLFTITRLNDKSEGTRMGRSAHAVWKITTNTEAFDEPSQTVKIKFKKTGPG